MPMLPAARPSSPSVKFTALDHADTSTTTNSTKITGVSVTVAIRGRRTTRGCPGQAVVVPERQYQNPEQDRGDDLSDRLGRLVQAQVARFAELDDVVEESDEAEGGRQEQHQQPEADGPIPSSAAPIRCVPR